MILLTLVTACGRSVSRAPFAESPIEDRPSLVLFLLIDTLRYDRVGSPLTPSLNALAERALVFESASATSSWTRSSIASMFASRYPTSVGVLSRDDVIAPDVVTLAEVLHAGGSYECAGISTNTNAGEQVGVAQGFDSFIMPDVSAARSYPDDHLMFPARSVTDLAVAFLRRRAARREVRPCFLFLHFTDPHAPYLPHPGILPQPEPSGRFDGSRHQLDIVDATPIEKLTAGDRDRIKYLYEGDVKYCDAWIGVLLREVAALGLAERTMVVATADHGEGLWDHGIRNHGRDLYEEMLHVPLIIHLPGMTARDGRRIPTPVSLIDLAPTILAACRIPSPLEFQGQDLARLDRDRADDAPDTAIYSEMNFDRVNLECIRRGRFKLIRDRSVDASQRGAVELYDLAVDPHEHQDLAGTRPDVEELLGAALSRWSTTIARGAIRPRKLAIDELSTYDLGMLRTLGYISAGEYDAVRARREASIGPP